MLVIQPDNDETEVEDDSRITFDKEIFALLSVYSTNDRKSIEVAAVRIHPQRVVANSSGARDEEEDGISMRFQLSAPSDGEDAEELAVLLGQHLHTALHLLPWAVSSSAGRTI